MVLRRGKYPGLAELSRELGGGVGNRVRNQPANAAAQVIEQVKKWADKADSENRKEFLKRFVPLQNASLTLDNRLNLLTETEAFNPYAQHPQNELQALHGKSKRIDQLNSLDSR